jgi:hydrogenase maturation protease
MNRIIGIGNRLAAGDMAGLLVIDRLKDLPLPNDVQVVEGGLGGPNLLRFVEDAQRVVFVDSLKGVTAGSGGVMVLGADEMAANAGNGFGHADGFAYLLGALPYLRKETFPDLFLVGIEGATRRRLDTAAQIALALVTGLNVSAISRSTAA